MLDLNLLNEGEAAAALRAEAWARALVSHEMDANEYAYHADKLRAERAKEQDVCPECQRPL